MAGMPVMHAPPCSDACHSVSLFLISITPFAIICAFRGSGGLLTMSCFA